MIRDRKKLLASFFGPEREITQATAPGRLDVMGGVSDYSGAMVLEYPIRESTTAHVALRNDRIYRVASLNTEATGSSNEIVMRLSTRFSLDQIARRFDPKSRWASYVIGCAAVLIKKHGARILGADILIDSDVPAGRGVSASAALEVATMTALCRALDIQLGDNELPALCQLVENRIAGAPCGVMDQTTSYLGRCEMLLPILCQPQVVCQPLPIPSLVHFVGIDSQVTHSVGGSAYGTARTAAFMGYEIIRKHLGASRPFDGYLANISIDNYETDFESLLPERMTGRTFLRHYRGTIDPVTEVASNKTYRVRAATAHPIYAHHRVTQFIRELELLHSASVEKSDIRSRRTRDLFVRLGAHLYESHEAYTRIGLGHPKTDEIVNTARDFGPEENVYGARVTGGGCGGTVCLLVGGRRGLRAAEAIAKHCTGSAVLFDKGGEGARWRNSDRHPGT